MQRVNKYFALFIILIFQFVFVHNSFAQSKYNKLVWADEFNKSGAPDASKWTYDIGGNGWGNNELEYYTDRPENVIVKNGMLHITALKEDYKGSHYTSARILTKGKFSFKYGRVEVRAKLPSGVGTWPAIWMLGSNIDSVNWPSCGEIDIMEHLGRDMHTIYGTLHYPGHYGDHANGKTIPIKDATQFHVYGLEWSPEEIKISLDGKVYQTVKNSADIPFNHNFFIILNEAMGGNFGGPVDPTVTKATMEVDYVRVYQ
ncbi:MAG TPA: glycoside hydrolase family 16 protein [Hanamia sp.]|nr:glycoside hydrolase family 16 protein [Hanamia sp.]